MDDKTTKRYTHGCPLILLIILLIIGVNGTGSAVFLIGPYPQYPQDDSITICWITKQPTRDNEVHWGDNLLLGNVTREPGFFAKIRHSVTIHGLAAGHHYFYRAISDSFESPVYSFWTKIPTSGPIRFVVYGDTQGDWDNWHMVQEVARSIEQETPQFVLKTGDFVDDGWNLTQWISYFNSSPFLHNSTMYPVLGNHEKPNYLYYSFFILPGNEHWYSFQNGPVCFIGLNSNTPDRYRLSQYLWLCHELRTHATPFTIVFFHHPLYSSSNHGNSTFLQQIWGPVFERNQVDLVFSGHDHNYEHSLVNNVTYIVTGGGGSSLYDNGHSPWTVYSEKTYHYCLLSANATLLTFEAKKPNGVVFDSFSLPD